MGCPTGCFERTGSLKDKVGMKVADNDSAKLGFEMLQNLDPEVIQLPGKNPNVDIKIVNYVMNKDIVLATLDKNLKSRINNKILTIRGKNNLNLL